MSLPSTYWNSSTSTLSTQRLAGVEALQVDDHPHAAVDHLHVGDREAVARDDFQRVRAEHAVAAGRGVEKDVARRDAFAVLVAVDDDLRELRARRRRLRT